MKKRTVAILGLVGALAVAATVYALPANEIETIYFSDASMSVDIGYRFLSCQGDSYREGITSRFYVRVQTPCSSGGLNEIRCILDGVQTTCPANICDSGLFSCS